MPLWICPKQIEIDKGSVIFNSLCICSRITDSLPVREGRGCKMYRHAEIRLSFWVIIILYHDRQYLSNRIYMKKQAVYSSTACLYDRMIKTDVELCPVRFNIPHLNTAAL